MRVLSVFGTRPEAIKMAPVVKSLEASKQVESLVCITAQHRRMLDSVLEIFNIKADFDLNIMSKNQNLAQITTRALVGLMEVIETARPDLVLVHGDTTTTMAASLAAFYSKVRVGHVEAGLRTYDKYAPFPEEMNRRVAGVIADLHFAPTSHARENLLKEGVKPESIFVTGNTSIDAAADLVKDPYRFNEEMLNALDFNGKRIIAMTAHRRENYGKPLEDICKAALRIVEDFDDVELVYSVHLSPVVQETAYRILGGKPRVHLISPPVDVCDMHNLMSRSYLVLSDSGGLQEEAPYHNIPVVVLRDVTERPEGVQAGCLVIGGTKEQTIYDIAAKLLTDKAVYDKMAGAENPFGDGKAAQRILKAITNYELRVMD
jgi:UDP-N-acetylglucosamine 2-epimerase (non-hydrolysing)